VAHFKKLQANGWTDKATALTNMKNQWKAVFIARANDLFNPIEDGGTAFTREKITALFGTDNRMILDQRIQNIDDVIYNFIKVE